MRLPLWREDGTTAAADVAAGDGSLARGERGKVLVVEDDPVVRKVLDELLDAEHRVESTASGADAIERVRRGSYDVALVDLGMPEMRGDRVVEQMRRIDPALATVLITGWLIEEGDPTLEHFDFRLQKPFNDVDEVLQTVGQAVVLRRRRAEA